MEDRMELPDDVLQLVREYAKPSERYKVGKRVLAILERDKPLGPIRKELQSAVRFHYETFRQLFLTLEKSYTELSVAVQKEYDLKRRVYTWVEYDLLTLLYMKCSTDHGFV